MSDREPVLVLHGVDSRSKPKFEETVAELSSALDDQWRMIPVYWGDLGAKHAGIKDTIGNPLEPAGAATAMGASASLRPAPSILGVKPNRRARGAIMAGVALRTASASLSEHDDRAQLSAIVDRALREELPQTLWLRYERNPQVLAGVGEALVEAAARAAEQQPRTAALSGGPLGWVKDAVKVAIRAVDVFLGIPGDVLGTLLNTHIRSAVIEKVARYLGDIFVYHAHSTAPQGLRVRRIQDRIDIALKDIGWDVNRPISVVAHSLGGIVSFDAAVRGEAPLRIKNLVTFGSQVAFFHVVLQRGTIPPYDGSTRVPVSRSRIGRWVNIWNPADPLAFIAGKVFVFDDGTSPRDELIPYTGSAGLDFHGMYWRDQRVRELIKTALTR